MARQEELTAWILQNATRFDLRVQELLWIKAIFPGWRDLRVSISIFGEKFVGRGSDPVANTALAKAVCEAVERATCFRHGIGSLGVAGHINMELAQENARLEYVERFCFSDQVSRGIALNPLSIDPAVGARYARLGVEIGLYRLASPSGVSVALCLANGKNAEPAFGGILGLGAASSIEAAQDKARLECLRNLEFCLHTKPASISREAFLKIERPTSQNRQALLRDTSYFQEFVASLNRTASDVVIPDGKFDRLQTDDAFGDCPLVFSRYSSEAVFSQPEFLA